MRTPSRIGRAAGLALLLIATPLATSRAQPGFPPNDPDSWRLAGTAKVLCSALFVSGRDEGEARAHLSPYFLGARLDSITTVSIDRQRKLVRLTLAGRITREAKLYGDQGCVIHQPGRDSVSFTPVRVTSVLPNASTMSWPMGDLLSNAPLPVEVDSVKLREAVDAAFASPAGLTAAFVVVYKGRIVAERYANGAHKDMQLESWSMGKSITGTLIGMLIQQGALRLEDPAPVPAWRTPDDPRAKIRVMDLMRMSSGLRFSRGSPEDIPGYHDHDLIYTGAIDAFEFSTTRPLQFPPNTFGRYRNADPLTLGMLIRDVVRKRGDEYLTWPQRALFDKIGIRRQVLETDPYGNFLLTGYDYGTARNWARLGLLYLNDGVWLGERLLPEGFVKFVSAPAPAWRDSTYGGMVWVNARGVWRLPRDAFAFRGAGGQEVYVVPSRDLVIVRMGHFPGAQAGGADLQRAHARLMDAIPARPGSGATTGNGRATPIIIGHRGASGYRPEHTLAAYELAIRQGADFIEPDVVITKDGVLVARHEHRLDETTDVAERFPGLRTVKRIASDTVAGWFVEDLTLAQLRTLRARERLTSRSHAYDGRFGIPTLDDVVALAVRMSRETGRTIGVYPETKSPSYFRSIGLPLEEKLVAALQRQWSDLAAAPVFVQSFEVENLKHLRSLAPVRLIQLLDAQGAPDDVGAITTYATMASAAGLREIARYAHGVGVNKRLIVPVARDGTLLPPTSVVADAHAAGLVVHVWTFRSDAPFLAAGYVGEPGAEYRQFLALGIDGVFSDFPDHAFAALRQKK